MKIPLNQFLESVSQSRLARDVGLTQGAISKMSLSEREIFVVTDESGKVLRLVEEKSISPGESS